MSNQSLSFTITNPLPDQNSPQYPTYFKKRECVCYVENPKNFLCAGCERDKNEHYEILENLKWNYKDCTVTSPTDAYGDLNFPGSHSKEAKYIRVEIETQASDMLQYMYNGWNLNKPQLILSVTGGAQKFTIPQQMKKAFKRGLIKAAASTGAWIITGGTNTGVMRLVGEAVAEEYHKNFRSKLTVLGIATWGKIAMRNEMIKTQVSRSHLSRSKNSNYEDDEKEIFYAGKVDEDEIRRTSIVTNHDVLLDSNHTHFILVDDGSIGSFGKEIEFRSRLEAELRKGKSLKTYEMKMYQETDEDDDKIPMILIVVQGGLNTLLTVEETIKQNIPILVLAESKGCADLIVNAYNSAKLNDNTLVKLIMESNILDRFKGTEQLNEKIEDTLNCLRTILAHRKFINIFRLNNEQDIEMTILSAFLNLNKNQYFENLKLALQWNRDDIAKSYIFTGEEEFKPGQLAVLMEMALIQNKPNFVELLLENGLNLRSFLTVKRLLFLYNSQKIHQLAKKAPLFQLYKRRFLPAKNVAVITFEGIRKFLREYLFEDFKPNFLKNVGSDIDLSQIVIFLKNANKIESSNVTFKGMDKERFSAEVQYPEKNLFVWAILMNRIEIAKIFWQLGEHQIITALFASNLCKSMSEHLVDLEDDLKKQADDFEDMGCGVLNIFDNLSDDLINGIILLQKIPYYDLDCLRMAVEAKCLKFIACSTVQNLLTDIWHGRIEAKEGFKASVNFCLSLISLGCLAPFLLFKKKSHLPKQNNLEYTLHNLELSNNKKLKVAKILKEYYINDGIYQEKTEPNLLPKCCTTVTVQNNYSTDDNGDEEDEEVYEDDEEFANDDLFNTEQDLQQTKRFDDKKMSRFQVYCKRFKHFVDSPRVHFVYETFFYLVFLTLFSYMMLCDFEYSESLQVYSNSSSNLTEEFHHVKSVKKLTVSEIVITFWILTFITEELRQFLFSKTEKTFKNKLHKYFSDRWNYIDFAGCLIYLIGYTLRMISLFTNENLFIAARIIYAFDLSIWYLRLLHVAIVFKSLGPKLVMIQKMVYDLLFFLLIIIIFVISFGVTTQSTMYPGNKLNMELVKSMINKAYWPIYGEMKILEEIDHDDKCLEDNSCPDVAGTYFSFVALMIYMIVANVLLINLLIAMFSSTYEDVQVKTDLIWKYQRYRLVFEYYDSSVFPPPLSLFAYITSTIRWLNDKKKDSNDGILDDDDEELFLEKKFAEEFVRNKSNFERETCEFRIKSNTEKLELLEQKLNELIHLKKEEDEN